MILFVDIVLTVLALVLLCLAAFLAIEILVGIGPEDDGGAPPETVRPPLCVLIPAHNEEAGIARTLDGLKGQLRSQDQILVVADNCDDGTTDVARRHGAEVIERRDPDRRGKGYALDFGIRHLTQAPPGIVIILDADCVIGPDTLDLLGTQASALDRPVQALYRMRMPADAPSHRKLAAFAFLLRSLIRPLGMRRLGIPCPLKGTGMAFPWPILSQVSLASGHIVEDVKLGIDLAIAGHDPWFEPSAEVWSDFPASPQAESTQRRRWEHGHLSSILSEVPRLLTESLRQHRLALAGAALDLAVPPLALFGLLLLVLFAATFVVVALGGSVTGFALACAALGLAILSLAAAWVSQGRAIVSAGELAAIAPYMLRKIPLYLGFLSERESEWVRTARDNEEPKP
jgi:cellulose synthase/poly-beta-1,6-N-acetylglucosamine synthase-like glycosyltransferase